MTRALIPHSSLFSPKQDVTAPLRQKGLQSSPLELIYKGRMPIKTQEDLQGPSLGRRKRETRHCSSPILLTHSFNKTKEKKKKAKLENGATQLTRRDTHTRLIANMLFVRLETLLLRI
jgi:hypothetical protein